ncbi:hypothetical protein [Arthrobacter sp. A5]|uniref:hypothetical protein n=1 Tax=Arthrobacter sp. A5 TaxID=576926 RepID=UPI003DA88446
MGGTWWWRPPSSLTQSTRALDGRGPVGLWPVEDSFGWQGATAEQIIVPFGARIYEIDGPEACAELDRRYPLEVTASRRHDWYRTTGRDGCWATVPAGWNPDQTYWLRDIPRNESSSQTWKYDQQEQAWELFKARQGS